MKKLAIMQPYLFPYLGYFQLMNAVDEYVIYDDVQFMKGGWINRNNILIGRQPSLFTIRLADASANKRINELSIDDDFQKFLKTVAMAYSRAPQKDPVMDLLHKICSFEDKRLAPFADNCLQLIAGYIGITTPMRLASGLRTGNELRSQERVIAICEELGADVYINPIGGKELYQKEDFRQRGIELQFLRYTPVAYRQSGSEFVPSLSIIDVMMFNEPAAVRNLLDAFTLE